MSAQDTTCAARAGEGPRARPYAELAGDLLVFFALRLGLALPARLPAQLDGFLDANEREPGLGGGPRCRSRCRRRMPLGSTIATWAGLMKTSPSASWRLNQVHRVACLAPCAALPAGTIVPVVVERGRPGRGR